MDKIVCFTEFSTELFLLLENLLGPLKVADLEKKDGLIPKRQIQTSLITKVSTEFFLMIEDLQQIRYPVEFDEYPSLLLKKTQGSFKVASSLQDRCLAGERLYQPVGISELLADPFLLPEEGQCPLRIACR
ncbi:hypothetical protein DSECCO2_546470 [anaerobic digester metagenome]